VELVAKYLYQFDIAAFNPRQVPTTDLQRAQKLLTLQTAGVDTWLLRCIEKGALPQPSGEVDSGATFRWEAARLKAAVYDHYHAQAGAHPKSGERIKQQKLHAWCTAIQRTGMPHPVGKITS
jgi:hypothetical protein